MSDSQHATKGAAILPSSDAESSANLQGKDCEPTTFKPQIPRVSAAVIGKHAVDINKMLGSVENSLGWVKVCEERMAKLRRQVDESIEQAAKDQDMLKAELLKTQEESGLEMPLSDSDDDSDECRDQDEPTNANTSSSVQNGISKDNCSRGGFSSKLAKLPSLDISHPLYSSSLLASRTRQRDTMLSKARDMRLKRIGIEVPTAGVGIEGTTAPRK